MRKAIALAGFVATLLAAPLSAERMVRKISFSALKAEGRLAGGAIVPAGGGTRFESLRVTNPDGVTRTIPLFEIDEPGLKIPRYVICGEVSGEGIEGKAYLEMWSFFSGGERYFSRTLAEVGPMGSLSGTFGFRPFNLPFTAKPGMMPEKLAVNVAFQGRGTVSLGNLLLLELDSEEYFLRSRPASWIGLVRIAAVGAVLFRRGKWKEKKV